MGNSALYHPWTTKLTNVERELTHDADAEKSIAIFNKLNNPKNRQGLIEGEGESTIVNVAPKGLNDIQSSRYYSYLATLATFVSEDVLNQYMIDGDSEKMYDNLDDEAIEHIEAARDSFLQSLDYEYQYDAQFVENMSGSGLSMPQIQRVLGFLHENHQVELEDLVRLGLFTNEDLLDDEKQKEAKWLADMIGLAYGCATTGSSIGEAQTTTEEEQKATLGTDELGFKLRGT